MTTFLKKIHQGKVRELFEVSDDLLLMVASDRISAYDCIFPEPIPNKGRVLTAMTAYWCEELKDVAPGSLVSADPAVISTYVPDFEKLAGTGWGNSAGRSLLVRRAQMLPIECIVRGYLAGQAYDEYVATGTVHRTPMRKGLRLADKLDEPIFTPSTKAESGHDINIDFAAAAGIIGEEAAHEAARISLDLYTRAAAKVAAAGFILADTKFELGYVEGRLCLCDEVITPDSSRIWPADQVVPGETPPAFDKQPLRDWAAASGWDKRPPAPHLPDEIVTITAERYIAAYERVTMHPLSDWYGSPT